MNMFIKNYEFIPNKKNTGKILNNLRKSKNMTYEDFAYDLGVTPDTVNKWIQGSSFPSIQVAAQIKINFGITLQDLFLPNSNCCIEKFSKPQYFGTVINDEHFNFENSEYDKKDYPIIRNRQRIDYENIFTVFLNNEIRLDYLLQKYFFSFPTNSEYLELCNYIRYDWEEWESNISLNTASNKLKRIEKQFLIKYGKSYKINLDLKTKNAILFDLQKGMNLEDKSSLEWLLLFNDIQYKKSYLNCLTPLRKDLVYNALLEISIDDFDDIKDYLLSLGARKLNLFLDYEEYEKNKCSGVPPFVDPNPLLAYLVVKHDYGIFNENTKRVQQIEQFHKAYDCLKYYLERLDYMEYLNLRGEIKE